jgi:tetratricopeptide (TPR) repeat protein
MKGELAEGVVPGLLRELYVGRRNGTLHFSRGSEEQGIRFHHGHIVNARTNVVEDRLGEILVRNGRLTEEGLARATEVVIRDKRRLGEVLVELGLLDQRGLEDAVALRVRELLAKVFTWDEGIYRFEDEESATGELTLRLSTGELILEAVRAIRDPDVVRYALGDMKRVLALSSDPLLRFQQLPLSPNDGFVLSRIDGTLSAREIEQMIPLPAEEVRRSLLGLLSTGVLEYEAAPAGVEAPETTADAGMRRPPQPDTRPIEPLPEKPGAEEGEKTGPVEEVPLALPADAFAGLAEAQGSGAEETGGPTEAAVADGATAERRREIEEAWEGLQSKNHFEVLGLTRKASAGDVKKAYFSLARRFHPDVHHGASLGDLRDKLEAVFIRLGEAHEVLRDQSKRSDYEERLGRPRPQAPAEPEHQASTPGAALEDGEPMGADRGAEAVQRAERLYVSAAEAEGDVQSRQKYWEAIQLVEPIHERLSGRLRLRARLVLARCYLENPNWVKRAEEMLQAVVREEPEDAEAYRLLGTLYEERGLRTRATSMFRRVLELTPDDTRAAEALARIGTADEPTPPEEGGGFLRKMFRRS